MQRGHRRTKLDRSLRWFVPRLVMSVVTVGSSFLAGSAEGAPEEATVEVVLSSGLESTSFVLFEREQFVLCRSGTLVRMVLTGPGTFVGKIRLLPPGTESVVAASAESLLEVTRVGRAMERVPLVPLGGETLHFDLPALESSEPMEHGFRISGSRDAVIRVTPSLSVSPGSIPIRFPVDEPESAVAVAASAPVAVAASTPVVAPEITPPEEPSSAPRLPRPIERRHTVEVGVGAALARERYASRSISGDTIIRGTRTWRPHLALEAGWEIRRNRQPVRRADSRLDDAARPVTDVRHGVELAGHGWITRGAFDLSAGLMGRVEVHDRRIAPAVSALLGPRVGVRWTSPLLAVRGTFEHGQPLYDGASSLLLAGGLRARWAWSAALEHEIAPHTGVSAAFRGELVVRDHAERRSDGFLGSVWWHF